MQPMQHRDALLLASAGKSRKCALCRSNRTMRVLFIAQRHVTDYFARRRIEKLPSFDAVRPNKSAVDVDVFDVAHCCSLYVIAKLPADVPLYASRIALIRGINRRDLMMESGQCTK